MLPGFDGDLVVVVVVIKLFFIEDIFILLTLINHIGTANGPLSVMTAAV